MFVRNESEDVIRLSRELLPASITAASFLVATDVGLQRNPTEHIVDMAGRISRRMAKTYLDSAAAARTIPEEGFFTVFFEEDEDTPPYGKDAAGEEERPDA